MNESTLQATKSDRLSRSGGIAAFPVAGAIYCFVLAICGYMLSGDSWRIVALNGSAMIFPAAFLLARLFRANLFVRDNPLASLGGGLPMATVGLLPFALCVVLDGSAIQWLPLAMAIGMFLQGQEVLPVYESGQFGNK